MKKKEPMRTIFIISVLILLGFNFSLSAAQTPPLDCPGGNTNRPSYDVVLRGRNHNTVETVIAIGDSGGGAYVITCAGRIIRWEFFARNSGQCQTVKFQVWRLQGGDTYLLVGENVFLGTDPRCTGLVVGAAVHFDIPIAQQIPVTPGDVVGWSVMTTNTMLIYDDAFGGSNVYGIIRHAGCHGTAVGNTCVFPTSTQTVRDYSVRSIIQTDDFPVFDNLGRTTTIPENLQQGTLVYTVKANPRIMHDPATVNHIVYYTIMNANGACLNIFTLDILTGEVTTRAPIDRNNIPNSRTCNLDIIATIDSRSPVTQRLSVVIALENLAHGGITDDTGNLVPQQITIDSATVVINTQLQTMTVNDPDYQNPIGPRIQKDFYVSYADPDASIVNIVNQAAGTHHIHNRARLRSNEVFRYWTSPLSYTMNFTATDSVHSSKPITMRFDITNLRTAPKLTMPPGSDTVLENEAGPRQIGPLVRYSDDQLCRPYTVSLRQYPLYEAPKFSLSNCPRGNSAAPDCEINTILNPGFDYDITKEYLLEVLVQDTNMGYTDRANFTVEVVRVNKPPEFTVTGTLTATMLEEEPRHTPVPGLVLQADDRDIKYGDSIFFRIEPGPTPNRPQHFYTIAGSNLLYINTPIDIDPGNPTEVAMFQVVVYDQQGTTHTTPPPVNGRRTVQITIQDINDNVPLFTTASFNSSILENTNFTNPVIGTFTATDRDAGLNAAIVYSIQNEATGAAGDYYFHIDPTSGELTVKHPLDYEQYHNISFKLKATDKGTPPLSSTMDILFNIEDRNDNRPMFSKGLYNYEVPSNIPIHTTVGHLTADDPDSVAVNNVTYFFLRPETKFYISAVSGSVLTEEHLSMDHTYFLYVHARDNGILPSELFSDPAIVRIDSFNPGAHLVDITLDLHIEEFDVNKEADFIAAMSNVFSPWIVKMWKRRAEGSKTILTFYVLEDNLTDDVANRGLKKHIVHRDTLLHKLRENREGSPSNVLRGREFAPFSPVHVAPTYPDFATETPGGIATVTIAALLGLALIVVPLVIMKVKQIGPFKTTLRPRSPGTRKVAPTEEFKLNYGTEAEKKNPTPLVLPPASAVLPSRQATFRPPPALNA